FFVHTHAVIQKKREKLLNLYLFKEFGYQNFIFFVHTDAIIQKKRENLLNPQSPKYLFSHELEIDGEKIT
ncbi:hypothetical protein FG626_23810, partial [Salmonella enterica subsp. enterica serovar Johannesburg]